MRRRGDTNAGAKVNSGSDAPLLGKFRDETGDRLTPTHTQKANRRHRYYVSNRLVSGKPDPTGWRLPAKTFETAVVQALSNHLIRAAERHALLATTDLTTGSVTSGVALQVVARIAEAGIQVAAPLIASGGIGKGRLRIHLSPNALTQALNVQANELSEASLTFDVPFAFLSPRIQQAILTGAHPLDLTLEKLVRSKLPMAWSAQEQILGFAKNC